MIKNKQKGFTLIELLVVIAIIGILSGTVIVSMSGAQDSAKNSRLKAGMDQMRSWAEVHRLLTQSYTNFHTTGDGVLLKADIDSQSPGTLEVQTNGTVYCISIQLNPSSPETYHCMDSTGKVGTKACVTYACPN